MTRLMRLTAILLIAGSVLMQNASAEIGRASWYAMTTRTASGERCNPDNLTAAHRTLPFGTKVEVENLANGKKVVVRINDRGPFSRDRIIDVTRAAASQLGFVRQGSARVGLRIVAEDN
jgi:rare lipoprotein A